MYENSNLRVVYLNLFTVYKSDPRQPATVLIEYKLRDILLKSIVKTI